MKNKQTTFLNDARQTLEKLTTADSVTTETLLSDIKLMPEVVRLATHHQSSKLIEAFVHWLISRFSVHKIDGLPMIKLWLDTLVEDQTLIQALKFEKRVEIKSFLDPDQELGKESIEFLSLLRKRRQDDATHYINEIKRSHGIEAVYLKIFQPVLYETGRLWQLGYISVAMEHYITAVIQYIMGSFYTELFLDSSPKKGKVLLSASGTELHEIGIRMIADLFELHDFYSIFIGGNLPSESILSALEEHHPDFVALSATLDVHVEAVTDTIKTIRSHPSYKNIKVLVGGQPFTRDSTLAEKIGADAHAKDIFDAIKIGEDWLGK